MTETKEEFQDLGEDCGHHCGKITVGRAGKIVQHCHGCHVSSDKNVCILDKE